MMTRKFPRFLDSSDGSSTIEFVVIFFAFMATFFFVVEATLYLFFTATLQKAAQAGVRAAVVSTPIAAGVPLTITRSAGGVFGVSCSDASAPCVPFASVSCTGAACDPAQFGRIFAHMRGFAGQLQPENVTITYQDIGLGFAGGPTVPLVTVRISGVAFQTGIVGLLLTNANVLAALPPQAASMTGEDLAP